MRSAPGKAVDLKATVAPDAKQAAQYYPAIYWYAMLAVPPASDFPGTGAKGNGMPETLKSQGQWLDIVKTDGCYTCHQLGEASTRTIPPALGHFANTQDAWEARIQVGQASENMINNIGRLDTQRALKLFAEWTDRINAGALPAEHPSRPQGVERNLVITQWDWSNPKAYLHDEIASDKRDPTVNANGPIYGATEESTQDLPVLDPVKNTATTIHIPVRDPNTPNSADNQMLRPSPYWGDEKIWASQASVHNPMFDREGRVWFTARIRGPDNPAFCKAGSDHPSAKLFPVEKIDAAAGDVRSEDQEVHADRHLLHDAPPAIRVRRRQHAVDQQRRAAEPGRRLARHEDVSARPATPPRRRAGPRWSSTPTATASATPMSSPTSRSIPARTSGSSPASTASRSARPTARSGQRSLGYPGYVVHLIPGAHPPETALTEIFEVPADDPKAPMHGYSPRGMDVDSNGVVWMPLASGHFASFDRRKCEGPLNGPDATGKQCPEGWTLYPFPGPKLVNDAGTGSAEASYYAWVDQHRHARPRQGHADRDRQRQSTRCWRWSATSS